VRTPDPTGISSQPLYRLAETMVDGAMILLDADGVIAVWGRGAEILFGYTSEEMQGRHAGALFTGDDQQSHVPEQEMTLAAVRGHTLATRWYVRKNGSRLWAEGSLTSLVSSGGTLLGFCDILRDITDRRQVNDTLKAALARERRIADVLQRPLTLAIPNDAFPGIEIATRYEAALAEAQIGGDFFDAFELPRGRIALVVADASGKGLSAAARAIHVKEVLRAFAREYHQSPDHIAARLNDYVCDITRLDDDSEAAFVTLNLAILDPSSGDASIVNAGAEPPLQIRRSGAVEPIRAAFACCLPLGILRGERYGASSLRLAPGDTLLMATDGITEARRSGPNDLLGLAGLSELAHQALQPSGRQPDTTPSGLQQAANEIVEGARSFAHGAFRDDVCLLMARLQRSAPRSYSPLLFDAETTKDTVSTWIATTETPF